ncbi:hypothetical protein [Methanocella sp. MCL-LM]|uniref:hypothetical protein n=1 Tax=Methanocella sp. MCL-LM TaxID=3412035 RepID=UPI003C769D7D
MELKYSQAIKAGIVAGVIMIILIVLNSAVGIIGTWTTSLVSLGSCCIFIVEILVLVGAGALAVRFAAMGLKDLNDALIVGAVAGFVTGIMAAIMAVIVAFVSPFLMGTYYVGTEAEDLAAGLGIAGISSMAGGMSSLCCCAPSWIVVSIVLGLIGAAVYYSLKK